MSATVNPRDSHEDAVIRAEARHLIRALAPYRVLHRDALEQVAGSQRWQQCSFERALAEAVRSGAIQKVTEQFYRYAA